MDMKLGGWSQLMMPKILKVTLRSAGLIQGQMRSNGVNILLLDFISTRKPNSTKVVLPWGRA